MQRVNRMVRSHGRTGKDRYARRFHEELGFDLRSHPLDHGGRWADEHDPGVGARPREGGVLREEAVARMDRIGTGAAGGVDDGVDTQVGVAGRGSRQAHRLVGHGHGPRVLVGIGEHRDGRDAELARGSHRHGARSRRGWRRGGCGSGGLGCRQWSPARHIRNTPKPRRPRTSLECSAESARPSTVRVSRGSMMPSS